MKRREFMKTGLISLASLGAVPPPLKATSSRGSYSEGQRISLRNENLEWELSMLDGGVRSTRLHNCLSGRSFEIKNSREVQLTLSAATARIEIPWWRVKLGRDHDADSPEREHGLLNGYHRDDFKGGENWQPTLNLLLPGIDKIDIPPVFNGYAWFRQQFELPGSPRQQPVAFCLGGYTQEDWNEYWVYLNGVEIGHWKKSGRWREPNELTVLPGSPGYSALHFGGGQKNLLAVRTFQCDKRFDGISDEVLDRVVFEARLCDQFITVGEPYRRVCDFKLLGWHKNEGAEASRCSFDFVNDQEHLQLTLHYQLEGITRRKWFELKNTGNVERLLLDVDLDDFQLDVPMCEGDYGQPLIVADELFCAVEHPAGINRGISGRVLLSHLPGKKLPAGGSFSSKVSLIGVAPQGEGREQFLDYIRSRSPRKGLLSIYDPLGINGFPDSPCWTLDDRGMLGTMDVLEKWQKQGVKFDYYVPDVGWQDRTGDMTQFWPQCFPNGPNQVIHRANELGMKWGLWFCATHGDWSIGNNPRLEPSKTIVPGGEWPRYEYRDGFPEDDWRRQYCLASEPYFTMFRDGLLQHIRKNNLQFYKVDNSTYYCNNPAHGHLPGKYSTEASFDALIEIAKATRQANPNIYIMWYWGVRSPFFLLYGDSIFEKRITLEAASTGDHPALYFRDAVTLALDQGTQFAEFIPPMCRDSLGTWITETRWGNSMRKERWQEAAVMDLGRGSLLFPQLWGDLSLFDDHDVYFLAWVQKFARQNEALLQTRQYTLGNPWKETTYGYSYFHGSRGLLFLNNVEFQSKRVTIPLDASMGLKSTASSRLRIVSHFPERAELVQESGEPLITGQRLDVWLRPFEVALWEILPDGALAEVPEKLVRRTITKSEIESRRLELTSGPVAADMEINFAEPDPHFRSAMDRPTVEHFKQHGYEKRIFGHSATVPDLAGRAHVLALVLRLRRDGKWWRYRQPADLIQLSAKVGDQVLHLEAVPSFRQTGNNQWAAWLVFRIRTNPAWSGQKLHAAFTAYLPPEVECEAQGWVVPEWWMEKTNRA